MFILPKRGSAWSGGGGSVEVFVSNDADDGFARITDGANENFTDWRVRIGRYYSNQYHSFFRFRAVEVPQGATITSALLNVQCFSDGQQVGFGCKINGNDSDDADAPSSGANLVGKAQTTAYVDITDYIHTTCWSVGSRYDFPDVKSVIQEIVDREGWASGNDMMLFIITTSDNGQDGDNRSICAYPDGSAKAAKLTIVWE